MLCHDSKGCSKRGLSLRQAPMFKPLVGPSLGNLCLDMNLWSIQRGPEQRYWGFPCNSIHFFWGGAQLYQAISWSCTNLSQRCGLPATVAAGSTGPGMFLRRTFHRGGWTPGEQPSSRLMARTFGNTAACALLFGSLGLFVACSCWACDL